MTLADKKDYKARVLVRDPRNDLALIKIDTPRKLPTLRLGDSDELVVGQKVLAIGNPFGFQGTLTTGIVSSLDRTIQTEENQAPLEGMIQTDAAINPGNSGGPLLDSHGNVIGINTAIYGESGGNIGIGFALPINRAKTMLDEFQKNGRIRAAFPGYPDDLRGRRSGRRTGSAVERRTADPKRRFGFGGGSGRFARPHAARLCGEVSTRYWRET